MKHVVFDLDSNALLSKDGGARPFMDIVLRYCVYSNVSVILLSNNPERHKAFIEAYGDFEGVGIFRKDDPMPYKPDLVIACDNELKIGNILVVPQYDSERTNEFAELAFAGSLLDHIKNKVVLRREAPEKQVRPERPPEPKKNDEDPSNWAYTV